MRESVPTPVVSDTASHARTRGDVCIGTTCEQWRIARGSAVLVHGVIWRRAVSAYLKSAAQLRKLAAKISDPEARQRIISVAEEYEAIAAASSDEPSGRSAAKPRLQRIPDVTARGKLH